LFDRGDRLMAPVVGKWRNARSDASMAWRRSFVKGVDCARRALFGGAGLDKPYVTTAREGFGQADDAREPLAGCLFRVRPGVRGYLPVPFAG
jgi:hypothetical protein